MTADDERRAEIEAVARALAVDNGWCYSPHFYRGLAEVAVTTLDRVRDARGDDELRSPATLGLPTKRECGVETQDLGEPLGATTRWCRYCSAPLTADHRPWCNIGRGRVRDEDTARSPQDEDHETARPEQPPPDTLGGQPPAEPPEAP